MCPIVRQIVLADRRVRLVVNDVDAIAVLVSQVDQAGDDPNAVEVNRCRSQVFRSGEFVWRIVLWPRRVLLNGHSSNLVDVVRRQQEIV